MIRQLGVADVGPVERIYNGSAWVAAHFTPAELPRLLATQPSIGVFDDSGHRLLAFLLANSAVPPSAWIGGYGVGWNERDSAFALLDVALPPWFDLVRRRGATTAYYSGYDPDNDWLRDPLLARGFRPIMLLRSYDKIGYDSPSQGDQLVRVRPFTAADLPGVLAVEEAAFTPLWRHDATEFLEVAREYPFFVVAETPAGRIAGYQFSSTDGDLGYLVRIAVHPRYHSQGVGTRLMAEAMRYFAGEHVLRILLNTEEANAHAHRLYEWFGFERVEPRGFVLARELSSKDVS
jgi:ribosomal-protein-alanine N-acetyltransferase